MALGDALVAGLLRDAVVEVRTAVAPPYVLSLADEGTPPGVLTRLVRPTLILRSGSNEVARVSPAGEAPPDEWRGVVLVAGVLVALLVVVLVSFLVR